MKNWRAWLKSAVAAFVSGGCGSVGTALTMNFVDPIHFNFSHDLPLMLKVIVVSFLTHGGVGLFAYLSENPFPKDS